MSGADFDELVGEGLDPAERARLRRTHELLLAAGPPPELTPSLGTAPGAPPPAEVIDFPRGYPRRRLTASILIAAAIALAAFGGGYLVAHGGSGQAYFAIDFVLPMQGTAAAPDARASLEVGEIDDAGNWPMRMTVRNLPERPDGGRYELALTKDGRIAASCGFFAVHGAKTVAFLNAPYKLRRYDDWVVTREGSREILLTSEVPEIQPGGDAR